MDGQQDASEPTAAEREPILVHKTKRGWQVDYGSYAQGYHLTREKAIEEATRAAQREGRALTIDSDRAAEADERDRIADERDRVADERDRAADERERAATRTAGSAGPSEAAGPPVARPHEQPPQEQPPQQQPGAQAPVERRKP
jgi:hypothetical protein